MTCTPEDVRGLMEWAAFLLVIVLFAAAGAWRWAKNPSPGQGGST